MPASKKRSRTPQTPEGNRDTNQRKIPRSEPPSRIPKTPVTDTTYETFSEELDFELSKKHFVALCAYLCILLRWGYAIKCCDLDAFITSAPSYSAWLPMFEQEEAVKAQPQVISYHHWLLQEVSSGPTKSCDASTGCPSVLTESVLRGIWRENCYIFLRTELTLEARIARVLPPRQLTLEEQVLNKSRKTDSSTNLSVTRF